MKKQRKTICFSTTILESIASSNALNILIDINGFVNNCWAFLVVCLLCGHMYLADWHVLSMTVNRLTEFMDFVDRTIDRKVNFQKLTFVKIDFLKLTFVKNWLLSSPMVVGSPLRSWTGENLTVPRFLKLCFFWKFPNFWFKN